MNRISFPRYDVCGQTIYQKDLEIWYKGAIMTHINTRLCTKVKAKTYEQERLLSHLQDNLEEILLMPASKMAAFTAMIDKKYRDVLVSLPNGRRKSTKFGAQILKDFNYADFRSTVLVELSAKLNVKTCPYCNMSYTVYAEELIQLKRRSRVEKLAKFQFDHFYDKMSYPMLSMSLYNLVPCCPVCNQGKSFRDLPRVFHPYLTDIHTLFKFEVAEPLRVMYGGRQSDLVEVKLKWDASVNIDHKKKFEDTFHLGALYSRHGDIVDETYVKAYLELYYIEPRNFSFMDDSDVRDLYRLWYGNYMSADEIWKRPLSKFQQDIRVQAQYPFRYTYNETTGVKR